MYDDLEINDTVVFKFLYEHGKMTVKSAYELATRILEVIPESHDYWPAVAEVQRKYHYHTPATLEPIAVEVSCTSQREGHMLDSFVVGQQLFRLEQTLSNRVLRYVWTGERLDVTPVPIPSTQIVNRAALCDLKINWRGDGWYPTEDRDEWRLINELHTMYHIQTFQSDPRERLGALAAAPVLNSETL